MKTILVTGGAGYIGSHLCEALLRDGHKVIVVDNFNDHYEPEYKRENIFSVIDVAKKRGPDCFIVHEMDIRDKTKLKPLFCQNRIDTVIHLAAYAEDRSSVESAPLYADVNINGTLNILECMKHFGVKKLLFASSSSVYGNHEKIPFIESDPADRPISPYAATKKAGELLCHTYHHLYGINIACLRLFTVLGPRQRPDMAVYTFTDLIMQKKPVPFFGDGSSQRDYIFITDAMDGILKALQWIDTDEKRYEIFNLGRSHTVSLGEVVRTIEEAAGEKAIIHPMPEQPGDVNCTYADIQKARKILGYDPRTEFTEGINAFIKWFKENRMHP